MVVLLIFLTLVIASLMVGAVILYQVVLQERERANTAEERADQKLQEALLRAGEQLTMAEKRIRADAIKKSKEVVTGKVAEQLVPFREDFPYNPRDCRFLGGPIDLIIFDGLTEGALEQIVLVEVKTGRTGALSRRERQVRNIVDLGEVYFKLLHVKGG